jgi:ubiquinone/menaquinone biosynthesis C-methylase UbiE
VAPRGCDAVAALEGARENGVASTLARIRDVWHRFAGRGAYPHELAFVLLLPLRALLLSPAELVRRLAVGEGARVLEIGPGPGYFSPRVARHVAQGRLELFDLQREMLAKARRRLRRAGAANVSFTRGDGAALPYRDGAFDAAFLVAVLGEVPDPAACVASVARVLRPGGALSVTELPGDPDALRRDEVDAMAAAAGLAFERAFPLRGGFTASYRKAPEGGAR